MAASVDTVLPPSRSPGALPRGDGSAVLLIPGFLSGDWATAGLRRFLAELGYAPHTAHILFNAGPTNATVRRLDRKVEQLSRSAPVSIVGVSLGGTLARDLARRHAGLVRCVITLCSPLRFPVTTPLGPFARALAPLHDPEWIARRHDIGLPLHVPVTAIHSIDDGVIDWRQCVQEEGRHATNVSVRGHHMLIASNPEAQRAVALALAATSSTSSPPGPAGCAPRAGPACGQ